jgi:hypothetical protein
MGNTRKPKKVKDQLTMDLKESTLSFGELGKKYGVTRQAIFQFAKMRGIKRPKKPTRVHTETCSICQSLIKISKKPNSDFICYHTIKHKLEIKRSRLFYHLQILRKQGLISQKFGRLKSRKAEKAYQIYFNERLPVRTIGRQVGLKNFYAIIKEHRSLGWDVPAPLFKYDSNDRKKTVAEMNRKKREHKLMRGGAKWGF